MLGNQHFFLSLFSFIMLSMKKESIYSNALIVKPGKKLAAFFMDFFMAFLVLTALFGISEGILSHTSVFLENQEKAADVTSSMQNLVLESGLGKQNEKGSLISQDSIVESYLKSITLSSLKMNGVSEVSSLYQNVEEIDEKKDGVFHYYVSFKVEHKDEFSDVSQQKMGFSYYWSVIEEYGLKDDLLSINYPYLTLDGANAMDEYFRNEKYIPGNTLYNKLESMYRFLLSDGVMDIQANCLRYIDLNRQYEAISSEIYFIKDIELFVSYFLAILVIYFLFPLLFHDGQTISYKVLSMASVDKEGKEASIWQLLIRSLVLFLESFVLIGITILVFYGSSGVGLLGQNLFGNLSLLTVSIYSFLILIISMTLTFALRNTHQSLSELISNLTVRDKKEFVVQPKELDENGRK